MERRDFLEAALSTTALTGATGLGLWTDWQSPDPWNSSSRDARPDELQESVQGPVWAIIPVVGDGKWIWTKPPTESTGYLEPRPYELKVGIQIRGTGNATRLRATTAAPVQLPEQEVEHAGVQTQGCAAKLRQLTAESGQLFLAAPAIARGQVITAVATYRMRLHKAYQGYQRDRFPAEQEFPLAFRKRYMYDSPGIQTRFKEVRRLAEKIGGAIAHPWDRARAFHGWVWENIKGRPQVYTSVMAAIRDRVGDCEERAAVFVALCRATGIPARLVWVPNHNWAEFFLKDESGRGHWIPAHTSAYSWFGWTGAHELVLQKGDSIHVPEKKQPQRLLADWMQWQGARPQVRYLGELSPLPLAQTSEAGPGARRKDQKGQWLRLGNHPLDAYLRDGAKSSQAPPKSTGG